MLLGNLGWLLPLAIYVVANPRYIIQLEPGEEVVSQFIQQDVEIAAQGNGQGGQPVSSLDVIKTIVIGDFQAVVTELDQEAIERAKKNSHVRDILADFEVRIFGKRDEGSDGEGEGQGQGHREDKWNPDDYDPNRQPIFFPDPVERERQRLQVPPPEFVAPGPDDWFGEPDDEARSPEEIEERNRTRDPNKVPTSTPVPAPEAVPEPTPPPEVPIEEPAPLPTPPPEPIEVGEQEEEEEEGKEEEEEKEEGEEEEEEEEDDDEDEVEDDEDCDHDHGDYEKEECDHDGEDDDEDGDSGHEDESDGCSDHDDDDDEEEDEDHVGTWEEGESDKVLISARGEAPGSETQSDAPGHLSRISFREGLYTRSMPYDYLYNKKGSGVTAYILDTGIAIEHPDFQGRAVRGGNFVADEPEGDQHGHGTHVAGLVGSKTFGVAKEVTIVEVKVLGGNGSGAISSILSGIEYAVNEHKKHGGKSVANLSLGSTINPIIDEAVNAAFKEGVVMVCAAGNSNLDVAFTSPARARGSFTVGALDTKGDTIAIFSNYGKKTDIFAPGVDVLSLNSKDFDKPLKMSGTSMASPIVAGLVATQLEDEDCGPYDVRGKVVDLSIKDEISIKGLFNVYKYQGTPNRISFNGIGDSGSSKNKLTIQEPMFEQDQDLLKYVQDINEIDVIDRELWELSEKRYQEREQQIAGGGVQGVAV